MARDILMQYRSLSSGVRKLEEEKEITSAVGVWRQREL
jgi:hypothetical protein